ncbi:MAG: hypothetical protein MK208_13865, partial [Shimia sp.]|uniref:hypothetical protein n=1 Tax=Shimia sp. TaxID=1954381 RepID=UPI00260145F9
RLAPVRPAVVRLSAAGEGVFSEDPNESQAVFGEKIIFSEKKCCPTAASHQKYLNLKYNP